jgi:hypothetical protein
MLLLGGWISPMFKLLSIIKFLGTIKDISIGREELVELEKVEHVFLFIMKNKNKNKYWEKWKGLLA